MAARSHVDNVINERRLRPIYDYLDNGNNRKALHEADKVIKKQKNSQCARVLKALALLRLGRKKESRLLLKEIHNEIPTEDATLQAITICYRELHQLDSIVEVYSAAVQKYPTNEELLTHLFMAYVRLGEYKQQHQVAMRLFKLRGKNPYYFWAVMSIVMQAHTASEEIARKMLLPLAERMTEKFAKENRIEAEAEVQLYLLILEMEQKYDEAMKVIQGPLGAKLVSFLNFKPVKCAELLRKLERWSEANAAYKKLIASNPDSWNFYLEYLASTFKLVETSVQNEGNERNDLLQGARTFIQSLVDEQKRCEGRALRGPFLAIIKLACMCREQNYEFQGSVVEMMLEYVAHFGDRACCFGDLNLFFGFVGDDEKSLLLTGIKNLVALTDDGSDIQMASDVKQMQRHMLYVQACHRLGVHDQLDVQQRQQLVFELLRRYRHSAQFGLGLLPTDEQPNVGYCLLATHILFDIWKETSDIETFYFMLVTLEGALACSPSSHQLKFILIKLYDSIGAVGPCYDLYDSMDIKHILQDALGYFVLPGLMAKGHFSQGDNLYSNMLKFFSSNQKDTVDFLIASYKFGSFTKIQEFVSFRERVNSSLQYASAVVERRIRELIAGKSSHLGTEQALTSVGAEIDEDKTVLETIRDNRDFSIMVSWSSPDKLVSESTCRLSFDAEVCFIKLRRALLRCLTAAHTISSDEKKTDENCVLNGVSLHTQDSLRGLITEFRDVMSGHTAETFQLPQAVLQESPQSRIVTHLRGRYLSSVADLLEILLTLGIPKDKDSPAIEKAEQQIFRKDVVNAIKEPIVRASNNLKAETFCRLTEVGDVLEDLVNIAEMVSFAVIVLGFCYRLLSLPSLKTTSKSSKKNPDDSLLLADFKGFVGELRDVTTTLYDSMRCVQLEWVMSQFRIQDESVVTVSEQDSESLLLATSSKIKNSYQKSLGEIGDLLKKKLKYMNSLSRIMSYREIIAEFFEYNTPHIVHIKSKKLGIFSRFVQLCIISYVIGFVILYKRGYQEFSQINSAVTTKVKGVAQPNFTDDQFQVPFPEVYRKVWDVADYIVPPQENGAFFVATNVVITPNQTQGVCSEDPTVSNAVCHPTNNTCTADQPVVNGNGIMTGRCVKSWDNNTFVCEVRAWCPVEVNLLPFGNQTALLDESRNFTVLIKNSIEFPLFGIRRRNVLNNSNSSYLSNCNYQPNEHPSCPVFRLGTIVELAGEDYNILAIQGGVMAIVINWDCDLDVDPQSKCNPTYSFRRLDDPYAKLAKGWNFRFAHYYSDNLRTLYKAYGIRFVVLVRGQGGKFNVVPLLLNVGSGLALLGITTVVCDIIVLYLSKSRDFYHEKKFMQVSDSDGDNESQPIIRRSSESST